MTPALSSCDLAGSRRGIFRFPLVAKPPSMKWPMVCARQDAAFSLPRAGTVPVIPAACIGERTPVQQVLGAWLIPWVGNCCCGPATTTGEDGSDEAATSSLLLVP